MCSCCGSLQLIYEVAGAVDDAGELWDIFECETLEAARECIGQCPRTGGRAALKDTLEIIEKSCCQAC